MDLAINNNNARPTIYLNQAASSGNWLRLSLLGQASNRDAVGTRVRLRLADGNQKTLTRIVEAGSGYASQSAFPVHFGLGNATRIDEIEIAWPSGTVDLIDGAEVRINQVLILEESEG